MRGALWALGPSTHRGRFCLQRRLLPLGPARSRTRVCVNPYGQWAHVAVVGLAVSPSPGVAAPATPPTRPCAFTQVMAGAHAWAARVAVALVGAVLVLTVAGAPRSARNTHTGLCYLTRLHCCTSCIRCGACRACAFRPAHGLLIACSSPADPLAADDATHHVAMWGSTSGSRFLLHAAANNLVGCRPSLFLTHLPTSSHSRAHTPTCAHACAPPPAHTLPHHHAAGLSPPGAELAAVHARAEALPDSLSASLASSPPSQAAGCAEAPVSTSGGAPAWLSVAAAGIAAPGSCRSSVRTEASASARDPANTSGLAGVKFSARPLQRLALIAKRHAAYQVLLHRAPCDGSDFPTVLTRTTPSSCLSLHATRRRATSVFHCFPLLPFCCPALLPLPAPPAHCCPLLPCAALLLPCLALLLPVVAMLCWPYCPVLPPSAAHWPCFPAALICPVCSHLPCPSLHCLNCPALPCAASPCHGGPDRRPGGGSLRPALHTGPVRNAGYT
jgi:hypothetical protein